MGVYQWFSLLTYRAILVILSGEFLESFQIDSVTLPACKVISSKRHNSPRFNHLFRETINHTGDLFTFHFKLQFAMQIS